MTTNHKNFFKIVLVGDATVGKTSLIKRYCDNIFSFEESSTIGIDFRIKPVYSEKKKKSMILHMWDAAGYRKYRSIIKKYYINSDCVLLCFSTSDEKTFKNIKSWYESAKSHASANTIYFLVGTKIDEPQIVSSEQIENFCRINSMEYIETSARNNIGINDAFNKIVKKLENIKDTAVVKLDIVQKKKKQCCIIS